MAFLVSYAHAFKFFSVRDANKCVAGARGEVQKMGGLKRKAGEDIREGNRGEANHGK